VSTGSARVYVEPDPDEPEVPLFGGDVTEGIVRIGMTVRRAMPRNAAYVHALLDHLESKGFAGAPRYLGVDAAGREVLTFVEGEVAVRPHPDWLADEARLASIACLVRAYDDATVDFVPPADVAPDPGPPDPPGIPPEPKREPEIVAHLDLTPENLVFRNGVAFGLIDFDFARPGTRVDELYNAMLWWAPLNEPADVAPALREVDPFRRCRILADVYGMSEADRARLVEVAMLRTRRSWHLMKHRAEIEGGGWQRMWDEGVGDIIKRRESWLERNAPAIHAALTT
jgi:hypothetical protein